MERSGPDDARDDAWDDAFGGSSDDDATSPSNPSSGSRGPGRDDDRDSEPDPLSGLDSFRGFGRFEGFDPFDPSGPDDGFGSSDALFGDAEDAVGWYPAAPVPAHERTWRHPSELGLAAWQQSEPPVSIGRGLLVTTGAIGSALGVAVLYLLLPAGGPSPAASPTATSSTAFLRSPTASVESVQAVTDPSADPSDTLLIASTPWFDEPGHTLPAPDTPSTVLVMAAAADPTDAPVSVAIAIEGAPYVVTTANAIGLADDEVHLMGSASEAGTSMSSPMDASVVSILGDLAFLEPSAAIEVVSFATTAPVEPGQPVRVLGDEPLDVMFVERSVPELDPGVIIEGTPVVDAEGALVALCTVVIDADGARVDLVPIHESTSDANPVAADATDPGASVASTPISASPPAAATTAAPIDSAPDETTGTGSSNGNTTGTTTGTSRPSATVPAAQSAPAIATTVPAPAAGSAPTAWIGLRFDGAPTSAPLTITGVVAGSPALAAGVSPGERLLAIDGIEVRTVADVIEAIRTRVPGDIVRLTLAPRVIASPTPATPTSSSTTTISTTAAPPAASGSTRTVSVVLAAVAPTV